MKNKFIYLAILFLVNAIPTSASESADTSLAELSQKSISTQSSYCTNWWLMCTLSKIVLTSEVSVLGPGVSGDP